jgi:hypothetical protein
MPRRALWLTFLWTLFVLYPNPTHLAVSIVQAWNPVIDPDAVRELAATLPDDPRLIEAAVNSSVVPYAVPWESYGVPWYFPTPAEVLARGQGDCQARAVVLASLLHAKGIDATLAGSFDHMWVEYPGKHATAQENTAVAIVAQQPSGEYDFRWPQLIQWRESWEIERSYFWDAMPSGRWWLLLTGWAAIGGWYSRSLRRLFVMLRANDQQPAAA